MAELASIEPKSFCREIALRAYRDTFKLLFGDRLAMMTAVLLFWIYVVLLWQFGSKDMASGEIALKTAANGSPRLNSR
jgi:hypothetical protein